VELLEEVRCPHQHTSTRGSCQLTAGEVWDDCGLMKIERGRYISIGVVNQKSLEVIERIEQLGGWGSIPHGISTGGF